MSGTTIFLRTPTLKLTIGQRNGLKSFMKKTNDKKEYRRAQAVLEKSEGKTHKAAYISMVWPEEKLMYNFYDEMNSTNTRQTVDPDYYKKNKHKMLQPITVAEKITEMIFKERQYHNGRSVEIG